MLKLNITCFAAYIIVDDHTQGKTRKYKCTQHFTNNNYLKTNHKQILIQC